jgi:preprotein translocase subunit SecA
MATGEGKTLTVALAAAVGALAGLPVHAITANDYLVTRDADKLRPLYAALGLSVGCVVQADERPARAAAYRCDIAYVTAKELVFDYLRDGQAGQDPGAARVLRGLCMAIVDEADAILLDEARVPLILSQPADMGDALRHARQALRFAEALEAGLHFELDAEALAARLTERGRDRLARATASADALADASVAAASGSAGPIYADLSPVWRNRLHREHAVCTALAALHLYRRERHYLVRDGRVQLIDETTGRIAEGRAWSNGLQQLVELKEGVAPSPEFATVAQITYQRFFPRYFRLGGLSGTLDDARAELLARYGLSVRPVPLRRPCRRRVAPTRLLPDHPSLWVAVARRVQMLHRRGRPVLVATDSVAEAQALADHLQRAGLPHVVLHARSAGAEGAQEAEVVARAGQRGAITVATNMAGRGTDIALGEGVAALGGLHVLSCQLNPARRIDRQLAGRAARQGDPGSVETWLSLDSALLARSLPARWRAALAPYARRLPPACVAALLRLPQWLEERRQCDQRERLTRHDEQMERRLAFAGRSE